MEVYLIIPTSLLTDEIVEISGCTSQDTVRKSLDGKLALIHFDKNQIPAQLSTYKQYTPTQVISKLNSSKWGNIAPWWKRLLGLAKKT